MRGQKRAPEMLRLLHLLALAIMAVFCAGMATPARTIVTAAPLLVAAPDTANAVRWASAPSLSPQWGNAGRPLVNLKAVATENDRDDDDDDDAQSDVADDAAACRGVCFPRDPGRASRGAAQIDRLRLAIGTGLPRGPPV